MHYICPSCEREIPVENRRELNNKRRANQKCYVCLGHEEVEEENDEPTVWDRFRSYRRKVEKYTEENVDVDSLVYSEKRALHGYHLHHKVPVWVGFKRDIGPDLIGSRENLIFVPEWYNMKVGRSITAEARTLLSRWDCL